MNIYKKGNIVSYWDEILSEEEYLKLYDKVKEEVLFDLLRDKYAKMILNKGSKEGSKDVI